MPTDPTRWCEIPIEPRSALVYGPGSLHTAVNRPGLGFSFVTLPMGTLRAMATKLRVEPKALQTGEVHAIPFSRRTRELAAALASLRPIGERPGLSSYRTADDAIASIAHALSADDDRSRRTELGKRIDSRRVVADCVEYAEAIDSTGTCSKAEIDRRQ